jgi:hypothetical protein
MARVKSDKHLDFIRSLPCLLCGDPIHTQAAHLRFADARVGKPISGMQIKSDDWWCVPLCNTHHDKQHGRGERKFWEQFNIDPILVAMALYINSGDYEAGVLIISANRPE